MGINYTSLKNEVNNDPTGLGYSSFVAAGNDVGVAALMNTVNSNITIRRGAITNKEIVESIDVSDYVALPGSPTAAQLSSERRYLGWMQGVMTVPSVRLINDNGTNTPVVDNFLAMFPSGTATRTRLIAIASTSGSRAEQLFGANTTISPSDISYAMRGTK